MKVGKKVILLGMILLLSTLIVSTVTTQAKPERSEINFEFAWTEFDDPKKEWTTKNNVLHTLMTPHWGPILSSDSDFSGELYYIGNLKLDLNTFSGRGGGHIEFTGFYNGDPAGFWGLSYFVIDELVLTGNLVLHGTGAFDGYLIKGTYSTILFVLPTTSANIILWN
ncbi:MAG: hypothetical protein ACXAAM_05575 [Candidatus Heimdallarchaeaceae archaeon]|jgi:hypothetical protein